MMQLTIFLRNANCGRQPGLLASALRRRSPCVVAGCSLAVGLFLLPLEPALAMPAASPVHDTDQNFVASPLVYPFTAQPTDLEIFRARLFEEPLVPSGTKATSAEENRALADALVAFQRDAASEPENVSALVSFLERCPRSPWRVSLLTNLGLRYRDTGYFARALGAWRQAWELGREEAEPRARAIVDRAVSQLIDLTCRLGRQDDLRALLAEVQHRDVRGSAAEVIAYARGGLWRMENEPGDTFKCGPWSLVRIGAYLDPKRGAPDNKLLREQSPSEGIALDRVEELARQAGLDYRAAWRSSGAKVITPCVVHWKSGHYAALLREDHGRYLAQDPTFGRDIWVSRAALDDEGSGYYLVPDHELAPGWRSLQAGEAREVRGKGPVADTDPGGTTPNDPVGGDAPDTPDNPKPPDDTEKPNKPTTPNDDGCGMPVARIKLAAVSFNLHDRPLAYNPPHGPTVHFDVRYNQREYFQPAGFTYSNLGPKWTFDWLSFLTDAPNTPTAAVTLYVKGGGTETYAGFNAATGEFTLQMFSRALLVRTGPNSYERRLPDGTRELFDLAEGSATSSRRVFLTRIIDPKGEALSFTYDAAFRLTTVTDALGQATTLAYQSTDPLDAGYYRIISVTDHFGRAALCGYNAAGQLQQITDVIGLSTQFTYGSGDVITKMTTPYGDTTFDVGQNGSTRWVQITDPLGGQERAEFRVDGGASGSEGQTPTGMQTVNTYLNYRNTLYWSKKSMKEKPANPSSAAIYHWLHSGTMNSTASRTPESIKKPLQSRVWYNYPGQGWAASEGSINRASAVGQVLSGGSSQVSQREYNNPFGRLTRTTDAASRQTSAVYDPNGVDLLEVRQTTAGASDLLAKNTYNAQHLPLTATDAAGRVTTMIYNAFGQPTTVTPPPRAAAGGGAEASTLEYDAAGYLKKITGPILGTETTYTYDGKGRVRTVTNPEGFKVEIDYDDLNRPTKVTYPDNTYTQTIYNRLDAEWTRDRLGRWSRTLHNALRQVVAVQDPEGRLTQFAWCKCGSLKELIDPTGKVTAWDYDVQGRMISKTFPDGTQETYAYDPCNGKLVAVTDALNQVASYSYNPDGTPANISYSNTQVPTSGVSFTYDPAYHRVATMTDAVGTTTYNYNPVNAALGAGRLASVSGPLPSSVVTYTTYDEFGRATGMNVNGSPSTTGFDTLGRMTSSTNALGTFTPTYVSVTSGRLAGLTYPNGMQLAYDYFDPTGDLRLRQIKYTVGAGALLDQHDYTYDAAGRIASWTTTQPGVNNGTARVLVPEYDRADQLVAAVLHGGTETGPELRAFSYGYDEGGNRTREQVDLAVAGASFNALNQLTAKSGGGPLRFAGTVSEPWSAVTVGGRPARVDHGTGRWEGLAEVTAGSNTVAVTATDPSGNVRTQRFQVTVPAASAPQSFSYDLLGQMTGDGVRTFEWDGAHRLSAINQGSHRSEFGYDGRGVRVRITERENGAVVSDRFYMNGEERQAGSGGQVLRRLFGQGEQRLGNGADAGRYFYARDHLGSVRELVDQGGAVRARYDFDPWGNRTKLSGDLDTEMAGFTGYWHHGPSGLEVSPTRAYSASLGRFLSRDPIAESGGVNLYAYVGNGPLNAVDPIGLDFKVNGNSTFKAQVKKDFEILYSQPGGKWLIEQLGSSNYVTQISPSGSINITQPDDKTGKSAWKSDGQGWKGDPQGSDVNFNPNITNIPGVVDVNGSSYVPTYVALAHELAHALEFNWGTSIPPKESNGYGYTPFGEQFAVGIENMIREENGVPERGPYIPKKQDCP